MMIFVVVDEKKAGGGGGVAGPPVVSMAGNACGTMHASAYSRQLAYKMGRLAPSRRQSFKSAMKKIAFLVFLMLPATSFAGTCADTANGHDDFSCVSRELENSKKDLNAIYQKIYSSTQYKREFEQSQKAWLSYREKQCNGYIAAEASQSQGTGPGLITKDCLLTITRQRVDYLKTLLEKR
ncbi:lysozyme inhibitor LprI family protein [Burkholderia pseudomultivorans]|uniref:lysozyme inhibitor LprI family protein n=1 Tax=Burkholderia pseudomultivorans TaxID=1207504 RepID=UPI001F426011|nr:lysozyme inhibitor LprI family protein [Burkholderia pseudomultivorans]